MSQFVQGVMGIRKRETQYESVLTIKNELDVEARALFCRTCAPWAQIKMEKISPGGTLDYDAGKTDDFDFSVTLSAAKPTDPNAKPEDANKPGVSRTQSTSGNLLRGAVYALRRAEPEKAAEGKPTPLGKLKIETVKACERQTSNKLENIKGISFGFSASGWLFIYQLGAAECLQNNGITRNPYVKVCGASGGGLTCACMMYGKDMPSLCALIKGSADKVYKDISQGANLRLFLLEAMKTFVKDGSHKHPAFTGEQVEVVLTESAEHDQFLGSLLGFRQKERRMSKFNSSADAVIALLASSSMGISGLPFTMKDENGQEVQVADGAFTDFMPSIDEFTINIKPFSDGLNMFGKGRAEIQPTEFIPGNYGVFPPSQETLDHLYELGYRDTESWINLHLEEHMKKVTVPDDAPTKDAVPDFKSDDLGMKWYEEVLRRVPVTWSDQTKADFYECSKAPVMMEEWLNLEMRPFKTKKDNGTNNNNNSAAAAADADEPEKPIGEGARREVTLTAMELRWHDEDMSGPEAVAPAAGDAASAVAPRGVLRMANIENAEIDPANKKVVRITSSEQYMLALILSSDAQAEKWKDELLKARASHWHNVHGKGKEEKDDGKAKDDKAGAGKKKCCTVM